MSVATIEIHLPALLHNIHCFKRTAKNSRIMAIVKANAYGHGLVEVARFLQEHVDSFGVARLDEALQLRSIGIEQPILLLEGFFPDDNLAVLDKYNLQTVVHSPWQIERLSQFKTKHPIPVWFKIDTGMHRLGFRLEHALDYLQALARCESVAKPIPISSHFCSADELDNSYTQLQQDTFEAFLEAAQTTGLPIGETSIAASGALFAWPQSHHVWVRPGITLYGISPFSYTTEGKATGAQLGLEPVMTLKSELISVRPHRKGEGVGYNQIWQSPRDTQLGVVAMGYGDGYPRDVPCGTPVLIRGMRYPIVGRVSMDMTVVDLGPETTIKAGDEVIFWGPLLPVEEIAAMTGFSAYELVTALTNRTTLFYKIDCIPE